MLFVYLLLLVASASAKSYPHRWYDLELADLYFEDFKNTHDRHYESAEEHDERFEVFKQNLIKINEHNMKKLSYTIGVTKFSDLTEEEFSRKYNGFRGKDDIPMVKFVNDVTDVPDSFDWRDKDMVSPVKNQGQCGSCWAFSATGLLESAARIQLGSQPIVSEQQIVDCDSGSSGCGGGMPSQAVSYVQTAGGIESEDDYPYNAQNGNCAFDNSKTVLSVTDTQTLNLNNDDDIKAALVKNGPLAFVIDATGLKQYAGGAFDCPVQNPVDHALLLVGYGSDGGQDYWIVKNSWGETFGSAGYFNLKRGDNTCLMYNSGFTTAQVAKAH